MSTYAYVTCDVFTSKRFGGNPLAVLPDARGLTSEQMLAITREFNYSETTFVLPPETGGTFKLRIFTPGGEVPFAGHPTVGSAHVLAAIGRIALAGDTTTIVFEEGVGPVRVAIRAEGGRPRSSQLTAAQLPQVLASPVDRATLSGVLSLDPEDVLDGPYRPEGVSCGLPFLFVPVRNLDAVRRSRIRPDAWEASLKGTPLEMVFVFCLGGVLPGSDAHARMYAPGIAVAEDPATGSACAALGGYLGARSALRDGTLRWTVEQGFEMGRESLISIEVDKTAGAITAVRVAGESVLVCSGEITV